PDSRRAKKITLLARSEYQSNMLTIVPRIRFAWFSVSVGDEQAAQDPVNECYITSSMVGNCVPEGSGTSMRLKSQASRSFSIIASLCCWLTPRAVKSNCAQNKKFR